MRGGQGIGPPGPGWEIVAGGPPGFGTLLLMVSDAPRCSDALGAVLLQVEAVR